MSDLVHADDWQFLRQYTPARLALGRTGHSLPTRALLDFNLDHARARDAVYSALDVESLAAELSTLPLPSLRLSSRAESRQQYLLRPDLGRQLSEAARSTLLQHPLPASDLCVVVADGLSATAVQSHAVPVIRELMEMVKEAGWTLAPVCLVEQGRVALADEVGYLLRAEAVVMLIGERPGLTSPDSLGAYLTWAPRPGLTDESRNCVSNIRPEGLGYRAAAEKLFYLLSEMRRLRLSGVALKDDSPEGTLPAGQVP
jgi:ethanolamine ammonia-lyase small subunit